MSWLSRPKRGAATVEMALVAPLLLFLLFGIIEFGFLVKHRGELAQASREGVRQAAVGAEPSRIIATVHSALSSIPAEELTVECRFRPWDEDSQTWGDWQTLGTADDGQNNATTGSQLLVRVSYSHPLLVPGLMARPLNADENGRVPLSASSVMMRE